MGNHLTSMRCSELKILRICALSLVLVNPAWVKAEELFDPFLGKYTGHAEIAIDGAQNRRDLGVTIARSKDGFSVSWTTTTIKPSGKLKTKSYSIDFVPTRRGGVYSSAMKTNVFGGRVALDPMQGDPYVWARIVGPIFTVFALLILDDGGYEMQVYERTLTNNGLDLVFSRVHNGEQLKEIRATLNRVKDN